MKVRSHILSPSVARGIAVLCAALFVASAHTAQVGVNVWTSHGPGVRSVTVLAIDPTTPTICPLPFPQRLTTTGGVAPSTGCAESTDVGNRAFVSHTADYLFYKAE